ncbi:hypothetical protein [Thiocapsa bogorovii]|uniref:hypothetical protein n=1 Tax=Thiocapsa bogorovii TaxID=521689 RepID=UPI001E41AEB6|nr:hypothetical protein [Thiocapsa bogorovii]UHD14550.1 hypothetical protein LT988_14720 [Thiocapsa bogorovii]
MTLPDPSTSIRRPPESKPEPNDNRVLVLGIYLPSVANHAARISADLLAGNLWQIDLRWAAVGEGGIPDGLRALTVLRLTERVPKFRILNRLLAEIDLAPYRFLVVVDDDIELESGFLDRFLAYQTAHDLTLAQPARTHDSYIDHYFVAQLLGVEARQTRFVEIGPVFSLRRDGFAHLLPFDEEAPMGWGLDFVWPVQLDAHGCRLGVIDASPVRHALRKPVSTYDYTETNTAMEQFLNDRAHLSHAAAFVALETYPLRASEQAHQAGNRSGTP